MTRDDLCTADEDAAFEFLQRAIPILENAGMTPATLNLLDSLNTWPTGYDNVAARTPGLANLAAEWAGPYQSQAVGAGAPWTVRALVLAALGADEAGDLDMGFRTYAVDETAHWSLEGTPLAGVPVFGLYLIKEGEATYCCSLTPSSWAVNLENVFCYPDQDGLPKVNGYGQTAVEAYMDAENPSHEGLDDTYLGYMGDRAALDKREAERGDVSERIGLAMPVTSVDLGKLAEHAGSPGRPDNRDAFADLETLAAAFWKVASEDAWEAAREYVQGNAVHPRALIAA